jgi:hypothetical protein
MRRRDLLLAAPAAVVAVGLDGAQALSISPTTSRIETLFWEWWGLMHDPRWGKFSAAPDAERDALADRTQEVFLELRDLRAETARELAMQIVACGDDGASELGDDFEEEHFRSILGLPTKRAWQL